MKTYLLSLLSCLFILISGCDKDDCVTATVVGGVGGCTTVLEIEENGESRRLEATNFTDFIATPAIGQVYCIEYEASENQASFCQMGQIVRVTSVE